MEEHEVFFGRLQDIWIAWAWHEAFRTRRRRATVETEETIAILVAEQRCMVLDKELSTGFLLGHNRLLQLIEDRLSELSVSKRQFFDSLDDDQVWLSGLAGIETPDLMLGADELVLSLELKEVPSASITVGVPAG